MHSDGLLCLCWLSLLVQSSRALFVPTQHEHSDFAHATNHFSIASKSGHLSNATRPASTASSTRSLIIPDPRSTTHLHLPSIAASSSRPLVAPDLRPTAHLSSTIHVSSTAHLSSTARLSSSARLSSTKASSVRPLITPDPRSTTHQSSTWVTIATSGAMSSAAPSTQTINGGQAVVAVIGVTYVAGAAGGSLLVGGLVHALAPGAVVTIIGSGPNHDIPEIETISKPAPRQNTKTADEGEDQHSSTSAPSFPSSTSTSSTSSSTPSSTGVPAPYIIVTSPSAAKADVQNLNDIISKDAAPNSVQQVVNERTGLAAIFKARITSKLADFISKQRGVSGVTPDVTLGGEDDTLWTGPPPSPSQQPHASGVPGAPEIGVPNPSQIEMQSDANYELRIISQPPGVDFEDLPGYAYASEAGEGVTIYVIDTGANVLNEEWIGMPGTKRFIYAPGAVEDETDPGDHGSCVASKAAGPRFGTAKKANLVAVKLDPTYSMYSIYGALIEISNDVYQKNLAGKAVITISIVSKHVSGIEETWITAYKALLMSIMAEDIVVVSSAGNYDGLSRSQDVNTYPALFGRSTALIVVAAANFDGTPAFYATEGSDIAVHAPGLVECASSRDTGPSAEMREGASFATPAVAGVIAVWLSQEQHKARLQVPGQVAANTKQLLRELAYRRVDYGPLMVWNGVDPRAFACSSGGTSPVGRREDGTPVQSGSCGPTTVVTAPASTMPPQRLPTSTSAPKPSSTSSSVAVQPSDPPKPSWNLSPPGFTTVFQGDGVASDDYDATSDSASERVTTNIEQWCLDKCTGQCRSVFLVRIVQSTGGADNIYYICNRYNQVWSNDFIQTGITYTDSGIAFK